MYYLKTKDEKIEQLENELRQLKGELRQWQMFAEKMERMAVSYEVYIENNSRTLGGRFNVSLYTEKAKALREIIELRPIAINEGL